jgi:AraC-like DNA-binding protein
MGTDHGNEAGKIEGQAGGSATLGPVVSGQPTSPEGSRTPRPPFKIPRTAEGVSAVVRNRIDAAPERSHSLEKLAEEVGLSQFHLCRVFSKFMGISPHQYVLRQRVEKAKRMLLANASVFDEEDRIKGALIATSCGFANQSHMGAVFRSVTGTTPGKWLAIRARELNEGVSSVKST